MQRKKEKGISIKDTHNNEFRRRTGQLHYIQIVRQPLRDGTQTMSKLMNIVWCGVNKL